MVDYINAFKSIKIDKRVMYKWVNIPNYAFFHCSSCISSDRSYRDKEGSALSPLQESKE